MRHPPPSLALIAARPISAATEPPVAASPRLPPSSTMTATAICGSFAGAKAVLAFVVQPGVTEHQSLVLVQGVGQEGDLGRVEVAGGVEADDLGADPPGDLADVGAERGHAGSFTRLRLAGRARP